MIFLCFCLKCKQIVQLAFKLPKTIFTLQMLWHFNHWNIFQTWQKSLYLLSYRSSSIINEILKLMRKEGSKYMKHNLHLMLLLYNSKTPFGKILRIIMTCVRQKYYNSLRYRTIETPSIWSLPELREKIRGGATSHCL